jgi:hypothetical protein
MKKLTNWPRKGLKRVPSDQTARIPFAVGKEVLRIRSHL